jgi:hypothetical protein
VSMAPSFVKVSGCRSSCSRSVSMVCEKVAIGYGRTLLASFLRIARSMIAPETPIG